MYSNPQSQMDIVQLCVPQQTWHVQQQDTTTANTPCHHWHWHTVCLSNHTTS